MSFCLPRDYHGEGRLIPFLVILPILSPGSTSCIPGRHSLAGKRARALFFVNDGCSIAARACMQVSRVDEYEKGTRAEECAKIRSAGALCT